MNFFAFHLMPWDRLPDDFEQRFESAWTKLPNSIYEPVHGHDLYNRYLDELVLLVWFSYKLRVGRSYLEYTMFLVYLSTCSGFLLRV